MMPTTMTRKVKRNANNTHGQYRASQANDCDRGVACAAVSIHNSPVGRREDSLSGLLDR
jgi:hypothetical protein